MPDYASLAAPVEWAYKGGRNGELTAIIRRLERRQAPTVYYRVVTAAARSEDRELIGRYLTLEEAAQAAHEHAVALSSWHHMVAGPQFGLHRPKRPPAIELVEWYRAGEPPIDPRSEQGRGRVVADAY